jgi:hypothetical protein
MQAGVADRLSVDKGAVATACISQQISVAVEFYRGVFARDLGIWQREVAIGTASKRERASVDGNGPAFAINIEDKASIRFMRGIHTPGFPMCLIVT